VETLQAVGVPAGNMQRLSEFDNNAHFLARRFFRHFDQPSFPGTLQTENGPVSFSELPEPEIRPAPFRGQHTRSSRSHCSASARSRSTPISPAAISKTWKKNIASIFSARKERIMKPFVFSCDAHIIEPDDLFTANLPEHLQQYGRP
jgi:hypothetical protein